MRPPKTEPQLTPHTAFPGLAFPTAGQRGVLVGERAGLGLATVLVRKGQMRALEQRVRARFGIELPRGPRRIASTEIAFAGIGAGAWLACREAAGHALSATLQEVCGGCASVADQSSGYAVLRLTGPKVRDTLAKLLPLDLHPRAFKTGDVASTLAAHVGAILWRLPDGADGSPVFEIAVFRSFAGSFWHSLDGSAAEFGMAAQQAVAPG